MCGRPGTEHQAQTQRDRVTGSWSSEPDASACRPACGPKLPFQQRGEGEAKLAHCQHHDQRTRRESSITALMICTCGCGNHAAAQVTYTIRMPTAKDGDVVILRPKEADPVDRHPPSGRSDRSRRRSARRSAAIVPALIQAIGGDVGEGRHTELRRRSYIRNRMIGQPARSTACRCLAVVAHRYEHRGQTQRRDPPTCSRRQLPDRSCSGDAAAGGAEVGKSTCARLPSR